MNYFPIRMLLVLLWLGANTSFGISQSCTEAVNLAENQSVQQSSVYGFGSPEIAVDGDPDGSRGPWGDSPSIIHTQREAQPWWQVSLAENSYLDTLRIYNRTDCCGNRLRAFYVFVSQSPFEAGVTLEELQADANIWSYFHAGVAGEIADIDLAGTQGKYIRVQLSGTNVLNLAEVEVWGCTNPVSPTCVSPSRGKLHADLRNPDTAIVQWEPVPNVLSYDLRYRVYDTDEWTLIPSIGTIQYGIAVNRQTEYEWEVRSVCVNGVSDWSRSSFNSPCFDTETAVANFTVTEITESGATINWSSPSFFGPPVTYFYYRKVGDHNWNIDLVNNTQNGASFQARIENLEPNSEYEWAGEVMCETSPNISYLTGPNFTTLPNTPPCSEPTGLFADVSYGTTGQLLWNEVPGASSYEVRYRLVGSQTWNLETGLFVPKLVLLLIRESEYEWEVRSICQGGASEWASKRFFSACYDVEELLDQMTVSQLTSSSAFLDWSVGGPFLGPIANYRYRIQGDSEWIEGFVEGTGSAPQQVLLENLLPNTTYEWEGEVSCSATGVRPFILGPTFTTLPEEPAGPTADLRIVPTLYCENDQFRALIQIRSARVDTFRIGTSSILLTYNDTALQFADYGSLNFDGSDLCVANVASAWDSHSFDGTSNPGIFNLTMILNTEQFSCPDIDFNAWVSVGEVTFDILDGSLEPNLQFDTIHTSFNLDQPNDGTIPVGQGDFAALTDVDLNCLPTGEPVPIISATPLSGPAPLEVRFDGTESYDLDGEIVLYEWDFGEGNIAVGPTATHTFTEPGLYVVDLFLTDDDGLTMSEIVEIIVTPGPEPPVASFTASPTSGNAPLTVSFDASSSYDTDGNIIGYAWFFGDIFDGIGEEVSHTYTTPGTYTAKLIVIDSDGLQASDSIEIEVKEDTGNGSCNSPQNLALGKEALQSTTYGLGIASIAVDGDTDGSRGPWGSNPSITHSLAELSPWWQVDLGEIAELDSVRIFNRTDCCQNRLKNFHVLFSDQPFDNAATLEGLLADPNVSSTFFSGTLPDTVVSLAVDFSGRYVRVQIQSSGRNTRLHISEVEVFGCTGPVVIEPEPIAFEAFAYDSDCFGDSTGGISLINISGGVGPYTYSIDGGYTFVESRYFDGLPWGEYLTIVKDSLGNQAQQIATIGTYISNVELNNSQRVVDINGVTGDQFGYELAMIKGEALIGARWAESPGLGSEFNSGKVWVLEKIGGTWIIQDSLEAPTAQADANFGYRIAMDKEWALIASLENEEKGAVYFYRKENGKWIFYTRIDAEVLAGDKFGGSLSISGRTAVISTFNASRTYLYTFDGAFWREEEIIQTFDPLNLSAQATQVSLSGNRFLIGRRDDNEIGTVYAWEKVEEGFVNDTLFASDGESGDRFGARVALSGVWAFVGATGDDDQGDDAGAVYVYKQGENGWEEVQKLTLDTPSPGAGFGNRLVLKGDIAIIGANRLNGASGGAYIYKRIDDLWIAGPELLATEPEGGANFGIAIDIAASDILVGAFGEDSPGTDQGAVYAYELDCISRCDQNYKALMAIYNATDGENWIRSTNWGVGCPCDNNWEGVDCIGGNILVSLDLEFNGLTGDIPDELGDLAYLRSLFLNDNEVSSVPNSIVNLTQLVSVFLNNTDISEFPPNVQNMEALYRLNLDFTQITSFPAYLTAAPNLRILELRGTQIDSIPESIENFPSLTSLDLGRSGLQFIPETIGNLKGLEYLWISSNNLEELPESIGNFENLKILDLKRNDIQCLPNSMQAYCDRSVTVYTNDTPVDWDSFCATGAYACDTVVDPGCTTPTNLALNQSASQSSTYGLGVASVAVDGDSDGSRGPWGSSPSIQHTRNEATPWWEVELAAPSDIQSVVLYNRTDCCGNRLRQFYILVSDSPFGSRSLTELLSDSSIHRTYYSGTAGDTLHQALNATGKYVRIQLNGSRALHMAEVEVMGCPVSNTSSQRFSQVNEELVPAFQEPLPSAYPNPFSEEIQLDLGERWTEAKILHVYNSLGQKILQQRLGNAQNLLLGRTWPAGIYWMEIHSGDKVHTLQVLKE